MAAVGDITAEGREAPSSAAAASRVAANRRSYSTPC
jgi:hypothetical protein